MDAKILGLCTAAIIVAAAGAIPSSRPLAATLSEDGVYEAWQRYSKLPANDFWYYHPGGPFYLYAHRRYAYAPRHAHHRRHQYAWRTHHGSDWAAHAGLGHWGGPPIDSMCWSDKPSPSGWREVRVC